MISVKKTTHKHVIPEFSVAERPAPGGRKYQRGCRRNPLAIETCIAPFKRHENDAVAGGFQIVYAAGRRALRYVNVWNDVEGTLTMYVGYLRLGVSMKVVSPHHAATAGLPRPQ